MADDIREPGALIDHPSVEPDILVPQQFFAACRHAAPERRLVAAVLEDALHCFRSHVLATEPVKQRLYADAEAWFASTDDRSFFSFENVCEALDLDAGHVRTHLWRWRDAARAGGGPAPRRRGARERDANEHAGRRSRAA